MKNTDKVTLTVGQIKKLIKESDDPLDSENINSRNVYHYLYDVIYDYLDKNYEDFGTVEFADGELFKHEKEIKKYVFGIISKIIDDVIYDIEADV
jgi:hypothetical protein